jgi:hypothetical protein
MNKEGSWSEISRVARGNAEARILFRESNGQGEHRLVIEVYPVSTENYWEKVFPGIVAVGQICGGWLMGIWSSSDGAVEPEVWLD